MKKLLIFKNGKRYVVGGMNSIWPANIEPVEEYDLTEFSSVEIEKMKKEPEKIKLTKLRKKTNI